MEGRETASRDAGRGSEWFVEMCLHKGLFLTTGWGKITLVVGGSVNIGFLRMLR